LRRLATSEGGFGLVELLIAMTVMVIAIMAIVAAFSSGMVAVSRASRASTAATLADIQMEGYRKVKYDAIPACPTATTSWSTDCLAVSTTKLGPDNRNYKIETFIRFDCATGTLAAGTWATSPTSTSCGSGQARPTKLMTVAVSDPSTTPAKELFRETSTFDLATGS
jgi:type II secretory pathway pseudopilin PulG